MLFVPGRGFYMTNCSLDPHEFSTPPAEERYLNSWIVRGSTRAPANHPLRNSNAIPTCADRYLNS